MKLINKFFHRYGLMLLLFLAFLLRFWRIVDFFDFAEEANHMLYDISTYVSGKQSIFLGLEATGYVHHLFLPPWYFFVAAPLFLLGSGEPLVFAYFHSAVGVLTVFLLHQIGVVAKKPLLGWIAALIYVVWTVTVRIDREFMAVTLVPFAVSLTILLLTLGHFRKEKKWYLLSGICLGLALSLHYQITLVIVAVLFWIIWKHKSEVLFVLVPIILSLFPLIIFDFRHNFFNLQGVFIAANTILHGDSPYPSSHYWYFLYVPIILLISYVLTKVNRIIAFSLLGSFAFIQIWNFFQINPGRNYLVRNNLANEILDSYKGDLTIFFLREDSYNLRYILFLRARNRGINSDTIHIIEPWGEGRDNAQLVVVANSVYKNEN